MNESPPPLPQWLLLRDPGIRKPALIVKFKFTVWPSDPCHNLDRVKGSAKTIFRLREVAVDSVILHFEELQIANGFFESLPILKAFSFVVDITLMKVILSILSI